MEYNKKINIRISNDQLKLLMSAVIEEKTTISSFLRNIINGLKAENPNSVVKRVKHKNEK